MLHVGKGGDDTTGNGALARARWAHDNGAEVIGKSHTHTEHYSRDEKKDRSKILLFIKPRERDAFEQ